MNLYSNITRLLLFMSLQIVLSSSSMTSNDFHSIVASISLLRVTHNVKNDKCVDLGGRFKILFPASGEQQKRSCKWVANKKTESRCALPEVKDKCPVTCGKYLPPTTSPTTSPTPYPMSTPTLTGLPTSITASPTGIYELCKDSDKRFSIDSIVWIRNKKNCIWVSQKTESRCKIDEAAANCPLSCGQCDKVFPSASTFASPTKALVANVMVTTKASVVIANLVIPTDEKVLNALKDALKKSAQAFVQPGSVVAKIDLYYAMKRKAHENEVQMDITTETKVDCPTQNVNSCKRVMAQAETIAATSNKQLAAALGPVGATAGESSLSSLK
jgi:hypothetical protein